MTDQELCRDKYKKTGNPFDLLGYDNVYDAMRLFPAFKVMIDMAYEELLNQIDGTDGDDLDEILQEAVKSHGELFSTGGPYSKEHYANNFILAFFQGDQLPDMETGAFRVLLAALSPFMGKPELYNVDQIKESLN